MGSSSEWYNNKLVVGKSLNLEELQLGIFDCVINVSDEIPQWVFKTRPSIMGFKYFWFPMNESKRDIGLNCLLGALKILYEQEARNYKVYLHCHAGKNRSQSVAQAYYFMRNGKHEKGLREDPKWDNELIRACSRGYLPPKKELESLLSNFALYVANDNLNFDELKKKHINNF